MMKKVSNKIYNLLKEFDTLSRKYSESIKLINSLKKENENLKNINSKLQSQSQGQIINQAKITEQGNLGIYSKKRSESKSSVHNNLNKDNLEGNLDSNHSLYKKQEFAFNPSRQVTMNSVGSISKYSDVEKNKTSKKDNLEYSSNNNNNRSNSKVSNAPYEKLMYEEGTININTINEENIATQTNINPINKFKKNNINNKDYNTNTVESVSNSKKFNMNLNFNKENINNSNNSNVVIPLLNFENVGNSKPNYKDKHRIEEKNNLASNNQTEKSNRLNESILDEHNLRIKSKIFII